MKISASPLVVAVALGLLGPIALEAEAEEGEGTPHTEASAASTPDADEHEAPTR